MKKVWLEVKDYLIIILIVVLIRTFVITPAIVDGASMDKTLEDGQLVIINKYIYRFSDIDRFDIVVVKNEVDNDKIIKRVIGLPKETITYKDNHLFINGELVNDVFGNGQTNDFTVELKDNEYFVMGDNREVSKDSRILGAFSKKKILGKVNIRLFPFNKFGVIDK